MRKAFFTATVVMVMMTTGTADAWEPVTYGDVRAQFEALDTGGAVIRTNQGFDTTIPPAGPFYNSIRPIEPFFDGLRHCEMDWHLVTIAFLVEPGSEGLLEETEYTFIIDNAPTPAEETTAIKTVVAPESFGLPAGSTWRAWGVFYATGGLVGGEAQLDGLLDRPGLRNDQGRQDHVLHRPRGLGSVPVSELRTPPAWRPPSMERRRDPGRAARGGVAELPRQHPDGRRISSDHGGK